ncbi:MAG: hypothetical protein ABIV26_07645 [Candidatus Limnocylindrales bacterium]
MPDQRPASRSSLPLLLAVAVALAGGAWMLQGLGILGGGSFMVGDRRWAIVGAVTLVAGCVFAARELRRS